MDIQGKKTTTAEKRIKAWDLRKGGYSYSQIAEAMGCTATYAHRLVKDTYNGLLGDLQEDMATWRQLELDRIEAVIKQLLPHIDKLAYLDRYLRAIDLQARIAGVYQPVAITNSGENQQIIQIISNPETPEMQLSGDEQSIE